MQILWNFFSRGICIFPQKTRWWHSDKKCHVPKIYSYLLPSSFRKKIMKALLRKFTTDSSSNSLVTLWSKCDEIVMPQNLHSFFGLLHLKIAAIQKTCWSSKMTWCAQAQSTESDFIWLTNIRILLRSSPNLFNAQLMLNLPFRNDEVRHI